MNGKEPKNSQNEEKALFFLKFGNEANMKDLYENGTIYFNPISCFQKIEDQGLRGDPYEGTINIKNYKKDDITRLNITDPTTGVSVNLHPTKFHLRNFLSDITGNLYSLYCIKSSDFKNLIDFKIDERVKEFGTHFVIIHNTLDFMNKIFAELENLNILYENKLVNYYDKEFINGDVSLFDKTTNYEYQKEYRIVLFNKETSPVSLNIGCLKDYAELFAVDAIDGMKLECINCEDA